MPNKDYYKMLGAAEDASESEIKAAYRKLAVKYHPDKNPGDKKSEEKFKEISEAYYALGDKKRRDKYDNLKKTGGFTSDFSSAQGFDFSDFLRQFSGGGFSSESSFGDLFGDAFSGGRREAGSKGAYTYYYTANSPGSGNVFYSNQEGNVTSVDTDIRAILPIPKKLAAKGGEAKFTLSSGKYITLKIPKGTKSGQKLRLRGQGEKCPCCSHKGDLIVTVKMD